MGSISTVSSQTFKTYCFMAEKEGWRDGEERRGEGEENREREEQWRGEIRGEVIMHIGREMEGIEFRTEAMEYKGDEDGREKVRMGRGEKDEVKKSGDGGKERRCECPQGESESEHPSLPWPADVP